MSTSDLLLITELSDTQEDRSPTVNEAIAKLEAGAGLFPALDVNLNTPPGSPAEGDVYVLFTGPTGAWSGHAFEIALYYNGSWEFMPPRDGLMAYAKNEDKYYRYKTGYGWEEAFSSTPIATLQFDFFATFIPVGTDSNIYFLLNAPFAITILSITTRAFGGGTGTLTGEINGTPLGGTANTVDNSEETQTHSSANAVALGDDFRCVLSVDSPAPTDLAITIKYSYSLV
jgi:hypothetical protein